mgnify:FL=1
MQEHEEQSNDDLKLKERRVEIPIFISEDILDAWVIEDKTWILFKVQFRLLIGNVFSRIKVFAWSISSLGVTIPIPLQNKLEIAPNQSKLRITLR